MKIGIPKEIKNEEFRVGLIPGNIKEFIQSGHEIFIQSNAGIGSGFSDDEYKKNGATILNTAEDIFETAELIIKVKEPQANERKMLKKNQLLFTYLHLAPDAEQTKDLIESQATCIAYETITDHKGTLPLLSPMSEIAGRLSVQMGTYHMLKHTNGMGKLIGGVPGVLPTEIIVIGGGVVGLNATKMAVGMGASVTLLDTNLDVLRFYDSLYKGQVKTLFSSRNNLEEIIQKSDMIIGGVLLKGDKAPHVITKEMLSLIPEKSVLVDVAIDQGGCFETSKPTTHDDPTFVVDDVIHYCVANMPGAVAKTSTLALNNAVFPFAKKLANDGLNALLNDPHFLNGLNVHQGMITEKHVANNLGYEYVQPQKALNK